MNFVLLHAVAAVLPCGALPSIVRRGDQHAVLDHLGHTLENAAPAPAEQPLPSALLQPAARQAQKLGYVVPAINALVAPSALAMQAALVAPGVPTQPRTSEKQAKILGFVVPGIAATPVVPQNPSAATPPMRTVPPAPLPLADTQARKLGYIVRGPPVLGSPGAPSVAGEKPGSSGETQASKLGYIVPSAHAVQTARPGVNSDTQALKLGYVVPGAPASAVVPSRAVASGVSAPVGPAPRVMQIARPGVPADAQALKLGYVVPGAPAKVAFPSPKNVTGVETVADALPVDPATQAKKLGYVVPVIPKPARPASATGGPLQKNTAQSQARRLGYIVPHAPRSATSRAPTWPATRDIPLPHAPVRPVRMPLPSSKAVSPKQRPPARRQETQSSASPPTTMKPHFQEENKDFVRNAVNKSVVINHTRTVITVVTKNVTQTNYSNVRDKMPWPRTSRRRVPVPMRVATQEPLKTRVTRANVNARRSKVPTVVPSTSAPPARTTTTRKTTFTPTRTTTRKVTTSALPKSSTSAAPRSTSTTQTLSRGPHASAGKARSPSAPPVARRWDSPPSPSPDSGKDAEWSNVSIGSGHHWSVPNFGFHRRRRGWNHTYPQFGMPSLFNHTFGAYNWTPSPPGPNPWEPAPTPSPSPSPASLPFGRPFSVGDV